MVFINQICSLSALGNSEKQIWDNYTNGKSKFQIQDFNKVRLPVSCLSNEDNLRINQIRKERKLYKSLDKSALMAILVARNLYRQMKSKPQTIGVNIGSSRGATETFEKSYQNYLKHIEVPIMTSPTTTLGNIATNVAQDLGLSGPAISHSITCSSALHALLNAVAFLHSGMLNNFIIGGTEAPLTGFTIAQMQALKLYSEQLDNFPCRSLDFDKLQNTLVLGEAACLASLSTSAQENSIKIAGIGYATENIKHSVALSAEANCLKQSMQMALKHAKCSQVDVVVMHAPGTIKGDISEFKAIQNTFKTLPALTTNKWLIGHTFGASGAMSLEMGVFMLRNNTFVPNPFYSNQKNPRKVKTVMINAVGFGGNAVSVILESPD